MEVLFKDGISPDKTIFKWSNAVQHVIGHVRNQKCTFTCMMRRYNYTYLNNPIFSAEETFPRVNLSMAGILGCIKSSRGFEHIEEVEGAPTDKKWYHGRISDHEAEHRLRSSPSVEDGMYLVYDNPLKRNEYVLLVYSQGSLYKWRIIRRQSDDQYVLGEDGLGVKTYKSVRKLIKHYRGITGKPMRLKDGGTVKLGDYVYVAWHIVLQKPSFCHTSYHVLHIELVYNPRASSAGCDHVHPILSMVLFFCYNHVYFNSFYAIAMFTASTTPSD